ncbi:MAG TPA: AbrB/MazE/SpoVT family DNA-binding domain-containing protein [Euryarchaeota archaeon]|nr:AbrB/MazE/SpoVT family DNA-binding domain-containing protein [Euryarchaeota archaeon]
MKSKILPLLHTRNMSIFYYSKTCLTYCGDLMDSAIVKVSSKGQVVIPAPLRKEMGLDEGDELYVFGKNDTLVFKKIQKEDLEKEFDEIVKSIREKVKRSEITRKDVEREIQMYRKGHRKNNESRR